MSNLCRCWRVTLRSRPHVEFDGLDREERRVVAWAWLPCEAPSIQILEHSAPAACGPDLLGRGHLVHLLELHLHLVSNATPPAAPDKDCGRGSSLLRER